MIEKKTVLIVDDVPDNVALLNDLLKARYRTKVAVNGPRALSIVMSEKPPDLVLLDVAMPGMDGHEVCRRIKGNERTRHIPVIFLTARGGVRNEQRGFDLGAVDYITKPISAPILKTRVKTHLHLKEARDELNCRNALLEKKVEERTRQLSSVQDVVMVAMGSLAETRDNETGNHIRRTQHYVRLLAEELSGYPRFKAFLIPETVSLLFKSSPLHDIGKVGVPDRILLKPGRLTEEEFEEMKKHTLYGRDAILEAEKKLDARESFLVIAREIAYCHHENWDGSGYPRNLSGDAVPISARIMAVCDVYDALISRRCYKPPYSHERAVRLVKEGRGREFDPDVVDAFLAVSGELHSIAREFAEPGEILE